MGSHLPPDTVNTPHLNPSQTGQYSMYLPQRHRRLSWPRWLVTYRDSLPAHRRSPIQVLTRQCTAGSQTHNLLITSPTPSPLHHQATGLSSLSAGGDATAVPTVCAESSSKGKGVCIAIYGNPSHNYGVSLAVWDHTVLPSTRHKWTHPAFTPARQAGTRFTDHLRMEGWVSPGPGCKEQLAHVATRQPGPARPEPTI